MKRAPRSLLFSKYCYGDQMYEHETDITWDAYGENRNAYEILVGKPEGKGLFGCRRRRLETNEKIKCDRRRVGEFFVNKTNRCTEFQYYCYYESTCCGQAICPSSGVHSRKSALVRFMLKYHKWVRVTSVCDCIDVKNLKLYKYVTLIYIIYNF
jgi:hypothetical protein